MRGGARAPLAPPPVSAPVYIIYIYLYIYSSKHTLIRWCAADSYAEAAGRSVPTSMLTDRKIIFLN